MGRGWIVFDEFLFFSPLALQAILPTLAVGAASAMISSLSPDGSNPVMKLLESKYRDGTDVIKRINWIQV